MHLNLWGIVGLAATLIGGWLGHRLLKPKDLERAVTLEKIAAGAATLAVSLFPTADWPTLLKQVVDTIATAAGVPTQNADAIQRAAATALTALGRNPGAPPR